MTWARRAPEPAHGRAWSKRVANRLAAVRMPPLGPKLYCFITCTPPPPPAPLTPSGECGCEAPLAGRSRGCRRDAIARGRAARLLIVYSVADVDVGAVRQLGHRRVEVNHVRRLLLRVQVRHHALHQRRLTRASHANHLQTAAANEGCATPRWLLHCMPGVRGGGGSGARRVAQSVSSAHARLAPGQQSAAATKATRRSHRRRCRRRRRCCPQPALVPGSWHRGDGPTSSHTLQCPCLRDVLPGSERARDYCEGRAVCGASPNTAPRPAPPTLPPSARAAASTRCAGRCRPSRHAADAPKTLSRQTIVDSDSPAVVAHAGVLAMRSSRLLSSSPPRGRTSQNKPAASTDSPDSTAATSSSSRAEAGRQRSPQQQQVPPHTLRLPATLPADP